MKSAGTHKKLWVALLSILIILVILRILLPSLVLRYANRAMADMDGYRGHVQDISLHLWRGAAGIAGIKIEKTGGRVPVPFLDTSRVEATIDWSELLRGALVGKVYIYDPQINFVKGPTRAASQTEIPPSWIELTREIIPFSVNILVIENASMHYRDFQSDPKIDVYLDKVYIKATNLTNSRSVAQKKFARMEIYNKPGPEDPEIRADIDLDTFARAPTLDINFVLNNLQLKRLNDFFHAYGNFDVEAGTFRLVSELSASEGAYKGYVKPEFKDLKVLDLGREKKNPFKLAWEAVVEGVTKALEDEASDKVATKVPIQGTFQQENIDYWNAILNLLYNAFIQGISPQFESFRPEADPRGIR